MGWIATKSERVLSLLKKQKDYTTICNPIVTEWLAALALRHAETITKRNQGIIESNIVAFEAFLGRHEETFAWNRPRGGTMGFAWRKDHHSVEPFCEYLLQREGLMLISGKYFDYGEEYFRLGLGRANFKTVLQIVENALNCFKF